MAKFVSYFECKLREDTDGIWVCKPLIYESDILQQTVIVPDGFETDLASVPRIPLVFWFWGGRSHREGVLHDYLYRKDSIPVVARDVADRIFYEAMACRGKSWNVRWFMFLGVRVGGWTAYHKRNVEDKL